MAVAEGAGWTAVATYARGVPPGRVGREIDSLAVRLRWRGWRAVAVWEDGKFAVAYLWRLIDWPRRLKHRQLMAELRSITTAPTRALTVVNTVNSEGEHRA